MSSLEKENNCMEKSMEKVLPHTFFSNASIKAVIGKIFPLGMRNWSASVSWSEIEVFDPETRVTLLIYKAVRV